MSLEHQPERFLRAPFAVLAGAGISMLPPSALPSAGALMWQVLQDPRLPVTEQERSTLQAATSAEWPEGLGAYHFLRFEQLVEALGRTVDPTLVSIRTLIPDAQPNEYHYSLATLILRGNVVFTTNFDQLIERAGASLGIQISPVVTETDYIRYQEKPDDFPNPLFKLHGSFSEEIAPSLRKEIATEAGIIGAGTGPGVFKWNVVKRLLDIHDLFVLGYSGYDDFDVLPALGASGKGRRIYWSRYSPEGGRTVLSKTESGFPRTGEFHFDFSVWHQLFGSGFLTVRSPHDFLVGVEDSLTSVRDLCGEIGIPSRPGQVVESSHPAYKTTWSDETAAPLLAGRLLMDIGRYDSARKLLHKYVETADSEVLRGRAHLWLAMMAADSHQSVESTLHFLLAADDLEAAPRNSLVLGDALEFLGFPVAEEAFTFESILPRSWVVTSDEINALGQSWKMMLHGFRAVQSLRRCADKGEWRQVGLVYKAFCQSPFALFQSDEMLADIDYWLAQAYFQVAHDVEVGAAADSLLNEAGARADRAARKYEILQRRRKFIDAMSLLGLIEVSEGKYDWARETAREVMAFSQLVGSHLGEALALGIQYAVDPNPELLLELEKQRSLQAASQRNYCKLPQKET